MAGSTNSADPCWTSPQQESNIQQLLYDAQTRWLKPAEVCEILNSHHKLTLSEAPPIKPTSGSLFLFDRNKLRYFRKDGHNWRKKKDGKTVQEAHEKLKAGNKDAIHCYYAHGEDNAKFQRRSYWLLEGGYEHIVLVHYREVTENNKLEVFQPTYEGSTSQYLSQMHPDENTPDYLPPSLISSPSEMISPSSNSHEDTYGVDSGDEFGDNQITRLGQSQAYQPSVPEQQQLQHGVQIQTAASQDPYGQQAHKTDFEEGLAASPWSTILESTLQKRDNSLNWTAFSHQDTAVKNPEFAAGTFYNDSMPREAGEPMGQSASLVEAWPFSGIERRPETSYEANLKCVKRDFQSSQDNKLDKTEHLSMSHNPYDNDQEVHNRNDGLLSPNVSYLMQSIQSDAAISKEGLPDDFIWIDVSPVPLMGISSRPGTYRGEVIKDQSAVSEGLNLPMQIHFSAGPDPLLSQKQWFSIVDFAPQWSYSFEETKVIVTGVFLDPTRSSLNTRWCCMFGEMEVPAEVLQSGALRCTPPAHEPGRVLFYVTCSDRVACSEIREFEYRSKSSGFSSKSETDKQVKHQEQDMLHQVRLAELLFTREDEACAQEVFGDPETTQKQSDKSNSFVVDQNIWSQIEDLVKGNRHPFEDAKAMLLQTLLKSKLQQWLHRKPHLKAVIFLDKHGLGVLHMVAALGYEWAIGPILGAGVGVNFRDAHGWTALHWAAFYGREKVIALLLAAEAAPGALTDPTPSNPTGRTAADLAASSGYDGIAGYLAEASLTSHLSSLKLDESELNEVSAGVAGDKAVEVVSEKSSVSAILGYTEDELSLMDSLDAVRNAAQAAARIQAAFRTYSFRKRGYMKDCSVNEFGMFEEEARAFAAAQTTQRTFWGHHEKKLNLAATQIQCKYRGWKGRQDFLTLRKQVVKIQAHVRGHQARKTYKKVLWTVGVLDKIILRWRRKGSGLRGFKAEEVEGEDSDDDSFLKNFRRRKEEGFDEALSRVKLMLQNPEARNQYRRMLETYENEKGAQSTYDDEELMRLLG